jgi:hypothetical protein
MASDEATASPLYRVLGVASTASEAEIRIAYRARAREVHPDTTGVDDGGRSMELLNEAYATLSDPQRRAEHDARIGLAPWHRGADRGGSGAGTMPGSHPVDIHADELAVGSSPLSAVIAVAFALGGILLGMGFAFLAPGLALFGFMLLVLGASLSAVRFRQAVKEGRRSGR